MTKEQKNDYTLRITQANSTELVIILYDMTLCYLKDAKSCVEKRDFNNGTSQIRYAISCIDELQNGLHYEYELAKNLKQIYLFIKKQLRNTIIYKHVDGIDDAINKIESLKSAYEKIKVYDNSKPLMENSQSVLTGITYNRGRILDSLTTEVASRGFTV